MCISFYKDENIRNDIIKPIAQIIYNDIYLYIWIVCFYSMLIILILLIILIIVIKILYNCTKSNILS